MKLKTLFQIERESQDSLSPFVYYGEYSSYVLVYTKTYDSDTVAQSNFEYMLLSLSANDNSGDVVVETIEGNGGTDLLLVNPLRLDLIKKVEKFYKDMAEYPILCEEHWSEVEERRAHEYIKILSDEEMTELEREVLERGGEYNNVKDLILRKYSHLI